MIEKHLLVAGRVRQPPSEGFSWIDRRFRFDFAEHLTGDAILLYFFRAAVSDKQGLSYFRDTTVAGRLRIREPAVVAARQELIQHDLVAYRHPLTQILSLPPVCVQRNGLHAVRELNRILEDTEHQP